MKASDAQKQSLVCVVIPTYNEADNLPTLVEELLAQPISNLAIIVVDDNSPDGTGQMAERMQSRLQHRLHVIHRSGKQGLGSAYREGFRHALELGADYIVQMDADGSHSPSDIPRLMRHLDRHDVVVGSRYIPGSRLDPRWSWSRVALSWWANSIYVRLILGLSVRDATGGFKCWSRKALSAVMAAITPDASSGFIFQVETAYLVHRLGLRAFELPIYFQERRAGQSKLSAGVKFEAMWRTWLLRWRYHTVRPMPLDDLESQPLVWAVQPVRIESDKWTSPKSWSRR